MANVRVKLTRNGPRQLRRQAGVRADLEQRAQRIAARAGDGFEYGADIGRNRARAFVVTATAEAMLEESQNRTLTRAIDAGR